MQDTGFFVPENKTHRLTSCYHKTIEAPLYLEDPGDKHSPFSSAPTLEAGGAGLVSTTLDYYRFCQMMLNGGHYQGVQILSPKTIQLMRQNHFPNQSNMQALGFPGLFSKPPYADTGYGLGMNVVLNHNTQSLVTAGTYGWTGAASTKFWIDPQTSLIVIFMTQLKPFYPYPIHDQLTAMIYGAFLD